MAPTPQNSSSVPPASLVPPHPPYPPAHPVEDDGTPAKLDLKPTQLAGGALAAVTSAFAASTFGVTGTVVGAAFGSIVSSVAAAVYAHSLTTAGQRIRTVVVTPVGARGGTGTADPADPTAVPGGLTGVTSPIVQDTSTSPARPPRSSRPRRFVRPALLLGGFAFAASIGAISATELALGHPVANTGENGISVVRVFNGGSGGSTAPENSPSTDPSSGAATPSGSPTDSGSPSPSASDQGSPPASEQGSASATDPAQGGGNGAGNGAGAPTAGSTGGAATSNPADPAPATSAPAAPAP